MAWKSTLVRPFAKLIRRNLLRSAAQPLEAQGRILDNLRKKGSQTVFGKEHGLAEVRKHADFASRVPIRDYEALRPWIDQTVAGKPDILWPGKPAYLAKTSGTTSGVKYIPITPDSVPNHFGTARNALFNYYARTGHGDWLDGKMIFLSGSPELEMKNGIRVGRLSGISNHMVPGWLKRDQLPSYPTNCIEDWEQKVDAIVAETVGQDLRLISGIPPWVQMYFERLLGATGKSAVLEVFPNLSMFVYGGVNYEPYRPALERLIGGSISSVETFPASEGFIAFQDLGPGEGLLLNVDSGIYFEFVPLTEYGKPEARRLDLSAVQLGESYALILSSNAGLWGYDIGDVVEFVSLRPYRVKVAGRVKHFISAFGEHVIGQEVEASIRKAIALHGGLVTEFSVAPQVSPPEGALPYHEWLIEFDQAPADMQAFAKTLDDEMRKQNIYYDDLIKGGILRPLLITPLNQGSFRRYMESLGRLGGQNKVPRLSNDRNLAERLLVFAKADA